MNSISVQRNKYKIEDRRRQVASLLARSLTETKIASQLNVSQPTVHRDIEALKQMSQQFCFDLARSDLAYHWKLSIDGLDAVREEAWNLYKSSDESIKPKDRLAALGIVKDCCVDRFEMINAGPSVLAMRTMEERLRRIENPEVSR
jgi:hypothetical protein